MSIVSFFLLSLTALASDSYDCSITSGEALGYPMEAKLEAKIDIGLRKFAIEGRVLVNGKWEDFQDVLNERVKDPRNIVLGMSEYGYAPPTAMLGSAHRELMSALARDKVSFDGAFMETYGIDSGFRYDVTIIRNGQKFEGKDQPLEFGHVFMLRDAKTLKVRWAMLYLDSAWRFVCDSK